MNGHKKVLWYGHRSGDYLYSTNEVKKLSLNKK